MNTKLIEFDGMEMITSGKFPMFESLQQDENDRLSCEAQAVGEYLRHTSPDMYDRILEEMTNG